MDNKYIHTQVLNMTNPHGTANQNHNEILLNASKNDSAQKDKT